MRTPEPFEALGIFWLPLEPDTKLPGYLRISESGEVTLEVTGEFEGRLTAIQNRLRSNIQQVDRIVGKVAKKGFVTLERCFPLSGPLNPTYVAELAYIGVKYGHGEEVRFTKISFSVEELDKWLAISGIEVSLSEDNGGISAKSRPPDSFSHCLPDQVRMELNFHTPFQIPYMPTITEFRIFQTEYVSLVSEEPRDIEFFCAVALRLCHLWSLALGQIVSIQSMHASTEAVTGDENGQEVQTVQVFGQFRPWSNQQANIRPHHMLFTNEDAENQGITNIFARWLESYKSHDSALNLYFASISDASAYVESRFLQLAQGIEKLHSGLCPSRTMMEQEEFEKIRSELLQVCPENRREWLGRTLEHANGARLRKRVRDMARKFKSLLGSGRSLDSFVNKVVITRNYYTHYSSELEEEAAKGQELVILYDRLDALFQLYLLELTGFGHEDIDRIVQSNGRLRRKLNPSTGDSVPAGP